MRRYLLTLTLLAASSSLAHAYSGAVTGSWYFYDTRSYTANAGEGPYTHAMKNTWRPIRHAKLYVILNGTNTVIGTGATNASGAFNIAWTSAVSNPSVRVQLRYESAFQVGGTPRFRIATAADGNWVSTSAAVTAINGGTKAFGGLYMGSTWAPHKQSTMFATATDFWTQAGSGSANLGTRLSGVRVRFPVAAASTGWTLSRTIIEMADNWVVFNNSTLAHEFGHVVAEVEFEQDALWGDCSWGGSGHSWDSTEWQGCAFQEGYANFVAAASFFAPFALSPTSYGYNIEAGCSGNNEWSESNVARMMWDIYDSRSDGLDGVQMPFWWIVDKTNIFPDGTSNRQDRENQVNQNGTNAWDFYYHALYSGNGANVNVQGPLQGNCLYNSIW